MTKTRKSRSDMHPKLKELGDFCKLLGVKYSQAYANKRTEGAYTIKLYDMLSPTAEQCAAMVQKAYRLGATDWGFKQVMNDPQDFGGWSFIMRLPPSGAPVQMPLLTTPPKAVWPGLHYPTPAEEIH